MATSVHEARDRVIRTALRALQAQHAEPCRYSDAEIEHTDEQLALAARDLTEATDERGAWKLVAELTDLGWLDAPAATEHQSVVFAVHEVPAVKR